MAEFCKCGSLMIDGNCTNKNCINKAAGKQVTAKKTASKKTSKSLNAVTEATKQTRTRRASKCITYNLYDIKEEES